jgi:hypothetical protein
MIGYLYLTISLGSFSMSGKLLNLARLAPRRSVTNPLDAPDGRLNSTQVCAFLRVATRTLQSYFGNKVILGETPTFP